MSKSKGLTHLSGSSNLSKMFVFSLYLSFVNIEDGRSLIYLSIRRDVSFNLVFFSSNPFFTAGSSLKFYNKKRIWITVSFYFWYLEFIYLCWMLLHFLFRIQIFLPFQLTLPVFNFFLTLLFFLPLSLHSFKGRK